MGGAQALERRKLQPVAQQLWNSLGKPARLWIARPGKVGLSHRLSLLAVAAGTSTGCPALAVHADRLQRILTGNPFNAIDRSLHPPPPSIGKLRGVPVMKGGTAWTRSIKG